MYGIETIIFQNFFFFQALFPLKTFLTNDALLKNLAESAMAELATAELAKYGCTWLPEPRVFYKGRHEAQSVTRWYIG